MINNQLQIFESQDFGQVRVILRDGQPWFVGKDVAERLGYQKTRNAITRHVDEEDKQDAPFQGDLGGTQNMTIINESGLYSLILSSKLPQAKAFKRWVTSEVLPAIRSQGMYLTQPKATEALEDPAAFLAKAMQVAQQVLDRKEQELAATKLALASSEAAINHLAPKAEYFDRYMALEDTWTVSSVAKMFNLSSAELFRILKAAGWLIKEPFMPHTISSMAPQGVFKIVKLRWAGQEKKDQIRILSEGVKQIEYLLRAFGKNI